MNYLRKIRKFMKKIVYENYPRENDWPLTGSFSGVIPDDLLKDKGPDIEYRWLSIESKLLSEYQSLYESLRKDIATEYLKDKELKDKLWHLFCDIYLNKDDLKHGSALKEKILDFLNEILKPIKEYEVFFAISDINSKKFPINIWNFTITKYTKNQLLKMFQSDYIFIKNIINKFSNKPLMIIKEKGNNSNLVVQRARDQAKFNLSVLQTYLSSSPSLRDEHLLFEISECALIRISGDSNMVGFNCKYKRKPYGLNDLDTFSKLITTSNEHYRFLSNSNPNIRKSIERAIFWIGRSILAEEYDDKVIALCTALESLLTTKDDKMKGESLAYRIILLHSILGKPFTSPFKIYMIYNLRSKVIHGSDLFVCAKTDYFTLLNVTKSILSNFFEFLNMYSFNNVKELVNFLESSDKVKESINWLAHFNNPIAIRIKNALENVSSKKD